MVVDSIGTRCCGGSLFGVKEVNTTSEVSSKQSRRTDVCRNWGGDSQQVVRGQLEGFQPRLSQNADVHARGGVGMLK